MTLAFQQNMQKWSFFFIFYYKTAPNDKIRRKNDQQLIGFLVLVKKMSKWGISPYFHRRKVKPIPQNLYTLLAHTKCMDTPHLIHKNYQSLILTLEWPGTWHNGPKKSSYLVKRAGNLTPGGQNACSRVCFLWQEIKPKPSKTT